MSSPRRSTSTLATCSAGAQIEKDAKDKQDAGGGRGQIGAASVRAGRRRAAPRRSAEARWRTPILAVYGPFPDRSTVRRLSEPAAYLHMRQQARPAIAWAAPERRQRSSPQRDKTDAREGRGERPFAQRFTMGPGLDELGITVRGVASSAGSRARRSGRQVDAAERANRAGFRGIPRPSRRAEDALGSSGWSRSRWRRGFAAPAGRSRRRPLRAARWQSDHARRLSTSRKARRSILFSTKPMI